MPEFNREFITLHNIEDEIPFVKRKVILWMLGPHGEIYDWKTAFAIPAVPKSEEEYKSIPHDEHPMFMWDDGQPMYMDDVWSYCKIDSEEEDDVPF